MRCWVAVQSPCEDEFRTLPAGDRQSLAKLRSRGWTVVRIFRAGLPWPAAQPLVCCSDGHAQH